MTDATGGIRKLPWIIGLVGVAAVVGVVAAIAKTGDAPVKTTLPAGTQIVARLTGTISTERAEPGDRVRLETLNPFRVEDGPPLPGGLVLTGEVTHAKGGGRVAGAPELTLRIGSLIVDGEDHPITTVPFRFRGKNDAKESALEIAGGAVAGAILGEVVADKAIEGAVIGAVAGAAVAVATKGDQIVIPAGTRLRVRLTEPVTVEYRPPKPEPAS